MELSNTVYYYKNQYQNLKVKDSIKNKKSNNSFKFKNDNGPISAFICYCSTPRWVRYISYHVLFDIHSKQKISQIRVLD